MNKQAISVTLEPDNLTWLRGRAVAAGRLSVSKVLDRLIRDARAGGNQAAGARSVVGTLQIADDDPDLTGADEAIRSLFEESLTHAPRPAKGRRGKVPGAQKGRG